MNCKGKEGKANGIVWYDMTWNGMKWNGMTYEYEYEYNTVLVPDTVIIITNIFTLHNWHSSTLRNLGYPCTELLKVETRMI